jgi:hypothetical protein
MHVRTVRTATRVLPLLAAGALLAACTGGGEDHGAPQTPSSAAERAEPPADMLGERWRAPLADQQVLRIWTAGDTVVVVSRGGVEGYDTASGERRWQLSPPPAAGDGAPCAASDGVNGRGVGAVLYDRGFEEYGNFGGCSVLATVDTGAGAIDWHKKLPNRNGPQIDYPDVGHDAVVVGDRVIAARTGNWPGADHYRFSLGGRALPPLAVAGGQECRRRADWVQSSTYTVVTRSCAGTPQRLSLLRTQTGEQLWDRPKPADLGAVSDVVATSPPAVAAADRLVSFTGDGRVQADVEIPGGLRAGPRLERGPLLAAATGEGFAGVDLRTGELLWEERLRSSAPAGIADGGLGLLAAYADDGGYRHLVRLDARDGARTEQGALPAATTTADTAPAPTASDDTLYVPTGGRLIAYRLP